MSGSSSSSSSSLMSDLFAAAREDAPSAATHDVVWGRVAAATSLPAGAAVATKAAASISSAKLVAIGAVVGAVGAAISVLALTTDTFSSEGPQTPSSYRAPSVVATGPTGGGARLAEPAPRGRAPLAETVELPDDLAAPKKIAASAALDDQANASALAEEARLVTEARGALVRGEPERALALLRSTRKLPLRVLEPEELRLESRALHALGRTDEAVATELTLRRRFPEQTHR